MSMTKSYEKLLEEFFTTDRWKLEQISVSDPKEILNDNGLKKLLKNFIERLDKDSFNKPNSLIAIENFDLLSTLQSLEDFSEKQDEIKCFCSRQSDLAAVVDESSLNRFVEVQKIKLYDEVGESYEYHQFKDYLSKKCKSKKSWFRRRH